MRSRLSELSHGPAGKASATVYGLGGKITVSEASLLVGAILADDASRATLTLAWWSRAVGISKTLVSENIAEESALLSVGDVCYVRFDEYDDRKVKNASEAFATAWDLCMNTPVFLSVRYGANYDKELSSMTNLASIIKSTNGKIPIGNENRMLGCLLPTYSVASLRHYDGDEFIVYGLELQMKRVYDALGRFGV